MKTRKSYNQRRYEKDIKAAIKASLETSQNNQGDISANTNTNENPTKDSTNDKEDSNNTDDNSDSNNINNLEKTSQFPEQKENTINNKINTYPDNNDINDNQKTVLPMPMFNINNLKESKETSQQKKNVQIIPPQSSQTGLQSIRKNESFENKSNFNKNLFVEFEIKEPTASPSPPPFKSPLAKKNYHKIGNIESSTTSSTSTSDDDLNNTSNENNQSSIISNHISSLNPLLRPIPLQLKHIPESNPKSIIKEEHGEHKEVINIENNAQFNDYDENSDYNEIEVDGDEEEYEDDDKDDDDYNIQTQKNDKDINFTTQQQRNIASQAITNNTPQSNFIHTNQPNTYEHRNFISEPITNEQQKQLQMPQIPQQQTNFESSSKQLNINFNSDNLNDIRIMAALQYLDQYDKNKKRNNKNQNSNEIIELSQNGTPFYTFKREILENDDVSKSFPTDPIKPSPRNNLNTMMGLNVAMDINDNIFNNHVFGTNLGYSTGLEREYENEFNIDIGDDNDRGFHHFSNSYSFDMAPYLQQTQQQPVQEQDYNDITKVNNDLENDFQIQDSNDYFENDLDMNENINLMHEENKRRSRYYQPNEDFESENDYDIETKEPNTNLKRELTKEDPERSLNKNLGLEKKKNSNEANLIFNPNDKNYINKSKQINAKAFKTVPFQQMNTEDLYSLMMNSMIYDENLLPS